MYRLQYIDNLGMSCCEWFESEDEAMAETTQHTGGSGLLNFLSSSQDIRWDQWMRIRKLDIYYNGSTDGPTASVDSKNPSHSHRVQGQSHANAHCPCRSVMGMIRSFPPNSNVPSTRELRVALHLVDVSIP